MFPCYSKNPRVSFHLCSPQLLDVILDGGGDDPVVVPDLLHVQVEGVVVQEVHQVEEAPRCRHLIPVQRHDEASVVDHVLRVRQLMAIVSMVARGLYPDF